MSLSSCTSCYLSAPLASLPPLYSSPFLPLCLEVPPNLFLPNYWSFQFCIRPITRHLGKDTSSRYTKILSHYVCVHMCVWLFLVFICSRTPKSSRLTLLSLVLFLGCWGKGIRGLCFNLAASRLQVNICMGLNLTTVPYVVFDYRQCNIITIIVLVGPLVS